MLCKVEGSCFSFGVWVYCDLLCVVNSCVLVAVFCFGCDKVSLIPWEGMCWVRVSPCVGEGCHMCVMGPICHLARVINSIRMPCEGMYVLLGCLVKECV